MKKALYIATTALSIGILFVPVFVAKSYWNKNRSRPTKHGYEVNDKYGFQIISIDGLDYKNPTEPQDLQIVSTYEPMVTRQSDGWHIELNPAKHR